MQVLNKCSAFLFAYFIRGYAAIAHLTAVSLSLRISADVSFTLSSVSPWIDCEALHTGCVYKYVPFIPLAAVATFKSSFLSFRVFVQSTFYYFWLPHVLQFHSTAMCAIFHLDYFVCARVQCESSAQYSALYNVNNAMLGFCDNRFKAHCLDEHFASNGPLSLHLLGWSDVLTKQKDMNALQSAGWYTNKKMYALGDLVTSLFSSSSIILMETVNGCVIYISVEWIEQFYQFLLALSIH